MYRDAVRRSAVSPGTAGFDHRGHEAWRDMGDLA